MLSSASRRTDRAAAATGALLLQLGFIAAFLHAFSSQKLPLPASHELTFFLPRLLPKPVPAPRGPSAPLALPSFAPPPLFVAPVPSATTAPPTASLQNFGRSLFGCAPENYTSLTPQQRAPCPRLGEGTAISSVPGLTDLPSQVKDNPHWANALAHKKSPLLLPGATPDRAGITLMRVDGSGVVSGLVAAPSDSESWPTYVDPKQFMPQTSYLHQQELDAWHKAHPQGSAEGVGVHPQ